MPIEQGGKIVAKMIELSFNEGYLAAKGNYDGLNRAWWKSIAKKSYDKIKEKADKD